MRERECVAKASLSPASMHAVTFLLILACVYLMHLEVVREMVVKLSNTPALKREMVVREEGEIMPTEQDPTMEVSMDLTLLHCPLCLCPLKPPVYECRGGHLACADFRAEHLRNHRQCQKCERGGGFDMRNTAMDAILSSVRVECPHEGFGLYVTYHKLADHQSVCPLAPCKCPVPVCGYEGPPPALPHHISTVHGMSVHRIQNGKVLQLQVPVSEPRRLLFAEEDGRVFFMVGGVLDIGAPIAVSVVCIRVGASPLPHYAAKVWANGPPGEPKGRTDAVKVEIEVTSSKEPGDVAAEEVTFTEPPKLLAGVGLSRTVSLHIQIDKLTF